MRGWIVGMLLGLGLGPDLGKLLARQHISKLAWGSHTMDLQGMVVVVCRSWRRASYWMQQKQKNLNALLLLRFLVVLELYRINVVGSHRLRQTRRIHLARLARLSNCLQTFRRMLR